jgi:hypothetical protein
MSQLPPLSTAPHARSVTWARMIQVVHESATAGVYSRTCSITRMRLLTHAVPPKHPWRCRRICSRARQGRCRVF